MKTAARVSVVATTRESKTVPATTSTSSLNKSEANPGTLTPEKLAAMKEGGIDRVSIGVQSFNPEALRLLGRIHTADQAVESFHALRAAGFENVNIDLIQSIPGMTPKAAVPSPSAVTLTSVAPSTPSRSRRAISTRAGAIASPRARTPSSELRSIETRRQVLE